MAEVARTSVDSRRRKRRSDWWIVAGVLAVLAAALGYAAWDALTMPAEEAGRAVTLAKPQAKLAPGLGQSAEAGPELINDDGRALWVSPTHGRPLDLGYLPPGVEIVVALRPAELLAHPEGAKVVAALGPIGARTITSVEKLAGVKLDAIERLLVGWHVARDGTLVATLVLRTKEPLAAPKDSYQPKDSQGRVTVIAPPATIEEVRELAGHQPPLALDLERVLSHTDSSRDVTMLLRPHALLNDTNNVFQRELSLLRRPLEEFLGNDILAASLSMHWDRDFFIELVAVPTLDSAPEEMSHQLAERVNALPDGVEEFVLGIDASPYGRRVVARLPEMVRRLAAYTRHGFDKDAVVLRCYLPVGAGHNLLMGAELALAEGAGARTGAGAGNAMARVGVRPLAEASSPGSIAERLRKQTSLRFAREELEAALDMLAQDVGVKIVIRGPDLQLDGITRNQLFAIDLADRPAEEILVEILRRANPDKLAAGPADPRQKLVYVVGPEAIFITTRARAAERGEPLPAAFQAVP